MSFWGVEIKPNGEYKQVVPQFEGLRVTQAALSRTGDVATDVSTLLFEKAGKKFAICHLTPQKNEHIALEYLFEPGEELTMSVQGPNAICLSGYREKFDDDEFDDDEYDEADMLADEDEEDEELEEGLPEGEEDEEEPAPVPVPQPKKKAATAPAPAPAAPAKKEKAPKEPKAAEGEVHCGQCNRKFKNAQGLAQHQQSTGHGAAAASPAEAPARVIGKKRAPEAAVEPKETKKEKKEEKKPQKPQEKKQKAPAPASPAEKPKQKPKKGGKPKPQ